MIISVIVAHDKKRGIGKDNSLPWAGKIPRDMARFKELTTGHPIIMGRKTFESIGRALPNRMNIVVTRNKEWSANGVWHVHSIEEALLEAKNNASGCEEIFIIGGTQLFTQALPFADRLYVTEINETFACDTFFPEVDPLKWQRTTVQVFHADDKNAFKLNFLTYEKKTA